MTETSISLLSIICGISGANLFGSIMKKHNFGLTGNSILGVFGSVFLIKSLGRLGFDPLSIMTEGSMNVMLFIVNLCISVLGGVLALYLANRMKIKWG